MKSRWVCLSICLAVLLVGAGFGTPTPREIKEPPDRSELKVELRLNDAQTTHLMEHYEMLVKRESNLQGSVRACVKSGDPRLAEYQQALQEAQDDLKATKKKLVQLESDRAKLVKRLKTKTGGGAGLESSERTHQLLEKILDRLSAIEKRLEKLERQK